MKKFRLKKCRKCGGKPSLHYVYRPVMWFRNMPSRLHNKKLRYYSVICKCGRILSPAYFEYQNTNKEDGKSLAVACWNSLNRDR